jgi:hypothetical protein
MMHYGGHGQEHCGPQQVQPVVCPPEYRVHDSFIPREVPFIHPIVNVNRQNIVDVPRHYFPETNETVMGAHFGPGRGPGVGPAGLGPAGLGPAGMGPGFGHGACAPKCCPRRRRFF